MKRPRSMVVLTMLSLAAVCAGEARAEVKILTERNDNQRATPAFKFRAIPPVSKDDIGGPRAIFSAIDGEHDASSGDLDKLSDGTLPTRIWDMGSHFFFRTGSSGGAILMDLGGIADLQQVNTYSWHSSTRGPQVYQLFAHDGQSDGFVSRPGKDADLERAGWRLVAKVDTRTDGKPGGQYGVSISDSTGSLGKFRYLIFKMERTESDDPYGNTFYSEIDVVGRSAPETAKAVENSKTPEPVKTVQTAAPSPTPAKPKASAKVATTTVTPATAKAPATGTTPAVTQPSDSLRSLNYRLRSSN